MADRVIPFPDACGARCAQSERIAVLEAANRSHQSQLDRIETKLDGVRNWLLASVFAVALALAAAIAAALLKQ